MRTKRQPTIKTLSLLTVLIAVQSAIVPTRYIPFDAIELDVFRYWRWPALLSGIFFWSLLPLCTGLFLRSARVSAAFCLAFGVLAFVAGSYAESYLLDWNAIHHRYGYEWDLVQRTFDLKGKDEDHVQIVFRGICDGPFLWIFALQGSFLNPIQRPALLAWLILYTAVGFFVAKSCRLRGQPKTTRPAQPRVPNRLRKPLP